MAGEVEVFIEYLEGVKRDGSLFPNLACNMIVPSGCVAARSQQSLAEMTIINRRADILSVWLLLFKMILTQI